MVSELAGEGAMPPQLPEPASRSLETAELRFRLRKQIRRGSLLRRGVNLTKTIALFSPSFNRSRSVKFLSKVLNNPLFEVFYRSRSVKSSSRVLDPPSVAIIVHGADPWNERVQCSLISLASLIHSAISSCSAMARVCVRRSPAIPIQSSSKVLVNALFIASNCSSWSRSSESLSVLVNPLCVVILVNMTAPENREGDRVLEEQFSENDQHEGSKKSSCDNSVADQANGWKASLAAVVVKSLIDASFGYGTDLNAGEQKNDGDLFADVSFRNSNGKEHESNLFYGKSTTTDRIQPNGFTFPCLFKALTFLNSPFIGQQLHALAIKSSLILDIFVGCNALDIYSKTSIRELADKVFEEMSDRNIATWNACISSAIIAGRHNVVVKRLFELSQMVKEPPNSITFCAFLNAWSDGFYLKLEMQLHGNVTRRDHDLDIYVLNRLIDSYGKCHDVKSSELVFFTARMNAMVFLGVHC
nr:pentatricopeptide repeat-containing protein At4g14850 [Ipomoea batatas]